MNRRSALAAAALVVTLGSLLALAQDRIIRSPYHTGQMGVWVPEPTNVGTWDGTWYHNSVDAWMALWIRNKGNKPEVKLKYESRFLPVAFETDWGGRASFYSQENPARFEMNLDRRDANKMEGSWSLELQFGLSTRTEKGKFSLFRFDDGRLLAIRFHEYEMTMAGGGRSQKIDTPPVWTFAKVSKRQALWDEIPF